MPLIQDFVHNGITTAIVHSPQPLGGLSDDVIAVVGTAPDADPATYPLNKPVRVSTSDMVAKLDTTGNGLGFLIHFCEKTRSQVQAPIYVIRVDAGVDEATTQANIIGGVDPSTGQKKGIQAIRDCLEAPTLIAAPGYSGVAGVAQALGGINKKINCRFVCDLSGALAADVINLADTFGNADAGFDGCIAVAHTVRYTNERGTLTMPGSVVAVGAIAASKPWEGPGHTGVGIDGVDVLFEYNVIDPSTDGGLLNKNGLCYFAHTSAGGWSLIGNRTLTGRFIAHVGLQHALLRKLITAMEKGLGSRLTKTFMEQEIGKINNWIESLVAEGIVMPGTVCYLHPEKNTVDNYMSGRWFIVVEYGAYGINENPVIELVESNGIVQSFLSGVL